MNNEEINVFKKNNTLIENFISRDIIRVTKSDLINSGFNEDFYLKKFKFSNKWLILFEDFYLEASINNEYTIHQY